MKQIVRFDELPNKIKYVVGGGIKDLDKARKRFGEMKVYECKNKAEIYKQMNIEALQPATLLDKDPLSGRAFFVAIGMPHHQTIVDPLTLQQVEVVDTVCYFAQMTSSEVKEALSDERKAYDKALQDIAIKKSRKTKNKNVKQ